VKTKTEIDPAAKTGQGVKPAKDVAEIIAEHPFLKGLSSHQFRILSDCAMFMKFEPGEIIFREGDPANRFYLIQKGKVMLESNASGGGRIPVQTVEAGEVLGWSWLFPPYYWHFDARAVEPTEALFFYGTPLREECENDHDLGYELVKRMAEVMMKRLQATRRQLLKFSS
jgi:CRP/FNR family cyclic AMP-dependent transcriptional regulator